MDELIVVRQLPIIEERMRAVKEEVDRRIFDSSALVCTESTVKSVKSDRAENRKLLEYIKKQLNEAESALLEPFSKIKEYFQKELIAPLERLDAQQKKDISEVEDGIIKKRCEDGLRDYFYELCAVRRLDWLEYERAGIKVDMASAKAKAPKKLREQLAAFVTQVGDAVDRILPLDNAEEIMIEFRRTLDAGQAICTVQERHRRIEEEKAARVARYAELEREEEAVRKVEALDHPVHIAPPEPVKPAKDPNEIIPRCTFTAIGATRAQLWKLKDFMKMEGIKYE